MINKAVILNAGLGIRLRPLTDDTPKCLTEINGRTILESQFEALEANGVKDICIVVGYLREKIIDFLRKQKRFNSLSVSFIENPVYAETNSAYSTWLARDWLRQGCLLIEGDIVFDAKTVKGITESDASLWLARRAVQSDDGCIIEADENGWIVKTSIRKSPIKHPKPNEYKSAGINLITKDYGEALSQWLASEESLRLFKDEVMAKNVGKHPLRIHDIGDAVWAEIDTIGDIRKAEKDLVKTKYVMVIMDGAADNPLAELGCKTPIEFADTPTLDAVAERAKRGLMRTLYPSLQLGSVVACLGILGFNPYRYHPQGRASFEAMANDIYLDEGEIAFRCNLMGLDGEGCLRWLLRDETEEFRVDEFACDGFRFYPGQGFRNILVAKSPNGDLGSLKLKEPQNHIGEPVKNFLLKGNGGWAKRVNGFIANSVEESGGRTVLLPWSASIEPRLPSFHSKYGLDGAVVSAMDFLRGIAMAAKMEAKKVPDTNGFGDTNMANKLRYAKNALRYNDFALVHVNAPDEESHRFNLKGKVSSIERIDRELLKPLKAFLDETFGDDYRLAVLPDHYTFVKTGKHGDGLVPYWMFGKGIEPGESRAVLKSYEFMDVFLEGR